MFMVLSYDTSHFESLPGSSKTEQRQAAADPQTKLTDFGCESACRLLLSTSTIAIYYYSAQS